MDKHTFGVTIDLETLALQPRAQILSIGAVYFNRTTQEVLNTFSVNIIPEKDYGRVIDRPTVAFWGKEEQALARQQLETDQVDLMKALAAFAEWLGGLVYQPTELWSKSPNFDMVILEDAFLRVPFADFRNYRDLRTYIAEVIRLGAQPEHILGDPALIKHVALDDAMFETQQLFECDNYLESLLSSLQSDCEDGPESHGYQERVGPFEEASVALFKDKSCTKATTCQDCAASVGLSEMG